MYIRLAILIVPLLATALDAEPLVYEGTSGVGTGKHIVFIANDHEYRSEQSCPALAKILAKHHGFRCTVLFGIDKSGAIKAGDAPIPGLEALKDADLLFFFTRFMNLPDEQVDLLVDYFERGGPVIGIRTSTHCFNGQKGKWSKLNFNHQGDDYLGGLGEQIFGNTWHQARGQSHYGTNHKFGCRITPLASAMDHAILAGVGPLHAYSGAYKSQPPVGATPLLEVQVLNTFDPSDDINADKPLVSAGWTRDHYVAPSGKKVTARVAYFSFGASEDLLDQNARRCLTNACLWASGMEADIRPDLNVSIVGKYEPSPFNNGTLYYEGVKPSQLASFDGQIMPHDAKFGGVTNPRMAGKVWNAMANRPKLRAKLGAKYPDLFGPDAKRPKPAKRKRLSQVFSDDFNRDTLGDGYIQWRKPSLGFTIENGVLLGKQVREDHGSILRRMTDYTDMEFEFDFRFADDHKNSRFNVVFDDAKETSVHSGHICRASVTRRFVTIQDDKTGAMNKEVRKLRQQKNLTDQQRAELEKRLEGTSLKKKVDLHDKEWHHAWIRIAGSRMTMKIDSKPLGTLNSPGIAHPTRNKYGITVSANAIEFDNWKFSVPKKIPARTRLHHQRNTVALRTLLARAAPKLDG